MLSRRPLAGGQAGPEPSLVTPSSGCVHATAGSTSEVRVWGCTPQGCHQGPRCGSWECGAGTVLGELQACPRHQAHPFLAPWHLATPVFLTLLSFPKTRGSNITALSRLVRTKIETASPVKVLCRPQGAARTAEMPRMLIILGKNQDFPQSAEPKTHLQTIFHSHIFPSG